MKVTMLLADAAQAIGGKLYILGGGWSVTGPAPVPSAVALYFQVPWDQADEKHKFRLELLDSDGQPFNGPDDNPLLIEAEFETGRPPGLKKGTPLDTSLAINVPPLQLVPDSRYEWRLTVNGEAKDEWRQAFTTRLAPPPGMIQLMGG